MKKTFLTLLSGACLLCSCGGNGINAEKLGRYADDLYITNNGSSFAVPDAMSISSDASIKITYEGSDEAEASADSDEGIENTTSTSVSVIEYNFATGYFHILSEIKTNGETEKVEIYNYANGKDMYTVGTMSGKNRYAVTSYDSEAAATENAIKYLTSQDLKNRESEPYYYSAGCDVLDLIIEFVGVITGSDTEATEGYDKYETTLVSANAKNETTFSGEFKTTATESSEMAGVKTTTDYNETMKFSFENGLLTSLSEDYTIVVSAKEGETVVESLTQEIKSNTTIKYSFIEIYPDLKDFEKVNL